jgi:4a-hydroxytetrahydrobiopterin dehydratase
VSEQGWRRFLAAEGVADWVVLHGGAVAVFRMPSLAEAARLAEAVAQIPGLGGALMTFTDSQLTVRLTRGVFQLEERHVELARAVSAVARKHGATADRTLPQEVPSNAPVSWILADRVGNRVCIAAWPDGASRPA